MRPVCILRMAVHRSGQPGDAVDRTIDDMLSCAPLAKPTVGRSSHAVHQSIDDGLVEPVACSGETQGEADERCLIKFVDVIFIIDQLCNPGILLENRPGTFDRASLNKLKARLAPAKATSTEKA